MSGVHSDRPPDPLLNIYRVTEVDNLKEKKKKKSNLENTSPPL